MCQIRSCNAVVNCGARVCHPSNKRGSAAGNTQWHSILINCRDICRIQSVNGLYLIPKLLQIARYRRDVVGPTSAVKTLRWNVDSASVSVTTRNDYSLVQWHGIGPPVSTPHHREDRQRTVFMMLCQDQQIQIMHARSKRCLAWSCSTIHVLCCARTTRITRSSSSCLSGCDVSCSHWPRNINRSAGLCEVTGRSGWHGMWKE